MIDNTSNGIVVDEANRTVQISRRYSASVERAWFAWTDAEAISRWWGPHGWATTVYEMDVRPGGHWRFSMAPADGSAAPVRAIAEYQQVIPQQTLGYVDTFADADWRPDGSDTLRTEVTFGRAGTGSSVRIAASFPDLDALRRAVELQMAEGYAEALERLDSVLNEIGNHEQGSDYHGIDRQQEEMIMTELQTVTSADGTPIAYEKAGSGPTVIVISTVAEDHTAVAGVAGALAKDFTVINFDRRGRGASGDPQPYDPAREIEDIAALVEIGGGSAALISGSGGCMLALDAASALGAAINGLYLYEPPFIVSDTRPPLPSDYVEHQEALVAAGKRSEAVEYFMTEAIRIPAEWVEAMKQDPSWGEMAKLAHTYAYDGRIGREVMQGKPLPTDRWSIDVPIMVMVGENGEPFMTEGANALAGILPNVTVGTLPGQDHSAFWMAPEPVAETARDFFTR